MSYLVKNALKASASGVSTPSRNARFLSLKAWNLGCAKAIPFATSWGSVRPKM